MDANKDELNRQHTERVVWGLRAWCGAMSIGPSTYYVLEIQPHSIKLGKRRLIVESPAAYVARIAQMQVAA